MKKILFLLLCTVTIYGQNYPTNPTAFGKLSINTNVEDNTAAKISVQSSDNRINWLQPINIPISIVPTNYAPTAPTLGGHILGIDAKLGALTGTTAGISTRVWFTADQTTITSGTFDLTNPLNKGTVASHQQTVANDDGQKKYFTTDLIGQPFATATLFPQGLYAGNLSVSTTPTNANQKFTVELYKCNNAGTPIASGVTGAVVGDLGVTIIMILDSGEVTLANASVTNVAVSTILGSAFNIAVGERIRYHVSAEKVGTAGGVINESVYYGSSYNSFLDVPVIYNSSSIKDISTVTNGSGTVTDALNSLKSSIPVNYAKTVYVNATNPNSATIFDDENPPITNDNALKADVNNLYIGTDASTWVYNVSTVNYVTKSIPSSATVFYNSGTTTPATNTTAPVYRTGSTGLGNVGINVSPSPAVNLYIAGNITGGTTANSSLQQGVIQSDVTASAFYNRTRASTQAASFTLPSLYHYFVSQDAIGAGSAVTNQFGFAVDATLVGAGSNYGFFGGIPAGTNRWNLYFSGTAQNYIVGNTGFGAGVTVPISKLDVNGSVSVSSGLFDTSVRPAVNIGTLANGEIRGYNQIGAASDDGFLRISAGGGVNANTKSYIDLSGSSTVTDMDKNIVLGTNGVERMRISSSGVSANSIDTNTTKITITTSTSITTATTDANGIRQDGRHVVISNGVNVINLTCNGGVTASYGKVGTGAITFVQGSGRTLVLLSGTAVFNGIAGSTATLWSNGTTDYLAITNY